MAAKSNTGLHISLILSVMLAIIGGVFAYIFYQDLKKVREELAKAKKDKDTWQTQANTLTQDMARLQRKLGYIQNQPQNLVVGDETQANSLIGRIHNDIQLFAQAAGIENSVPEIRARRLAQATVRDTLAEMSTVIKMLEQARKQEQSKTEQQVALAQAATQTYADKTAIAIREKNAAENTLKTIQSKHQEEIDTLKQTVRERETRIQQITDEMQKRVQAYEAELAKLNDFIQSLTKTNEFLRDKLEGIENFQFDRPDGKITYVDPVQQVVWINLGRDHALREQLTFSVFARDGFAGVPVLPIDDDTLATNRQVSRAAMKGRIEVIRILGNNEAECRIIDESNTNPFSVGDLIYTPLWSPGMKYEFAFAGNCDIDGDGQNDWPILKDLVLGSNGHVTGYLNHEGKMVDEKGNEIPEGKEKKAITVTTKFLVIGDLPDPAEVAPNKQAAATKTIARLKELRDEARVHGVRVVSLADFTEWMGFNKNRRLFRPGDNRGYTLKSGAKSPSVGEVIGDRQSTGRVSGVYDSRGRLIKPDSPNRTGIKK